MKRLALSLAMAACLALPVGTAAASGPKEDLVSGTGQGVFGTQFGPLSSHAHVTARGDATDARGKTWTRFFDTPVGDVLIKASVYCVNAVGNQAIVGVIVEQSNTTFVPPGSTVLRWVIDNGEGSNDPPDQTGTIGLFPPPPTCPPPALAPIALGPVVQGNFVVKDDE
jgi:hypothetical protein